MKNYCNQLDNDNMEVSWNGGNPLNNFISVALSIKNHPFWGSPFQETTIFRCVRTFSRHSPYEAIGEQWGKTRTWDLPTKCLTLEGVGSKGENMFQGSKFDHHGSNSTYLSEKFMMFGQWFKSGHSFKNEVFSDDFVKIGCKGEN